MADKKKKKLRKKILKEPTVEKKTVEGPSRVDWKGESPEAGATFTPGVEVGKQVPTERPEATHQEKIPSTQTSATSHRQTARTAGATSHIPPQSIPPTHIPSAKRRQPKFSPERPPKFLSFFPYGKVINFLGKRKIAYIFSAVLFVFSSLLILTGRVPLSTDFKGGISADVRFQDEVKIDDLRNLFPEATIQKTGKNEFLIKLPIDFVEFAKKEGKDAGTLLSEELKKIGRFELRRVESVGAIIGRELREKGIYAAMLSLVGIFIYIVLRFEWRFALGAVIALIHDLVITTGIMSLVGVELSLVTLAGLLALAGYSVNDSVIIADRIREKLKFARGIWKIETFNKAISETLARTVATTTTTFLPVITIILFGGQVLRDLGTVFLIGLFLGTYSSIFVVSALAFDIYNLMKKKKGEKK